jgi:hypothetical protein
VRRAYTPIDPNCHLAEFVLVTFVLRLDGGGREGVGREEGGAL